MKFIVKKLLEILTRSETVRRYLEFKLNIGEYRARQDPDEIIGAIDLDVGAGKTLKAYPFGSVTQWRYDTLRTKEPETLEWIEGLGEGVLWDVGANIGLYSIYAAARTNLTVLAFEPAPVNYFILTRNIHLNRFDERVMPYAIAFSNRSEAALFNMGSLQPGGAMGHFGESVEQVKAGDHVNEINYRQAMLGFSIDEFVKMFNPAFPNFMKIDVDGIENKIIQGGMKTFSDPRFKSLSIEVDDREVEYNRGLMADI